MWSRRGFRAPGGATGARCGVTLLATGAAGGLAGTRLWQTRFGLLRLTSLMAWSPRLFLWPGEHSALWLPVGLL
eukprot:322869-Karenia_brevis.AAC.1